MTVILTVVLLFGAGRAPAAQATQTDAAGELRVSTVPKGASVYLDGNLVGVTPVTVPNVAAGVHRVRLSLKGYLDRESQIEVPAGGAGDMRVDLVKDLADQTADSGGGEAVGSPRRDKRAGHWLAAGVAVGVAAVGILVAGGNDPVNTPPSGGEIIGDPPVGVVGVASSLAVNGVVDSGGQALTYAWTLGDGATAAGSRVTHTYTAPGFYSVNVVASDGEFSTTVAGNHLVATLTGSWTGAINGGTETRVDIRQEGPALGGTLTFLDGGRGLRAPLTGHVSDTTPGGFAYPVEFSAQFACCGEIRFVGSFDIRDGGNRLAGSALSPTTTPQAWILTR
jgi:hypothetical protein